MGKRLVLYAVLCAAPLVSAQTLHVYGPGGPSEPLKECAGRFTARTGVRVEVTAGPTDQWMAQANADADIVYGGAEYMLTQFDRNYPGFLLAGSRVELGSRSFGILVRPGNPKHINSLRDLARPGIKLLDVSGAGQLGGWEDIAGSEQLIGPIERNITTVVGNSAEALQAWHARRDLDAWITFVSWARRLQGSAQVVALSPRERIGRGTPAAITTQSTERSAAAAFLRFLQSPEGHAVFVKWGWD